MVQKQEMEKFKKKLPSSKFFDQTWANIAYDRGLWTSPVVGLGGMMHGELAISLHVTPVKTFQRIVRRKAVGRK
jgi:hypothetical protein